MRNGEIPESVKTELLKYLTPKKYECGTTRRVFDLIRNTSHPVVVKVACHYENGLFWGISNNITEFSIWANVSGNTVLRQWFCPVRDISDCGKFLIMDRCEPAKEEDLPEKIPDFLADVKLSNWGVITENGVSRTVMVDYAAINTHPIPKKWGMISRQTQLNIDGVKPL